MSDHPELPSISRGRVRAEVIPVGEHEHLVMRAPGVVHVLPIDLEGKITLVRQWRPAIERHFLEAPAGGIDPGETAAQAGRRELAEETGLRAGRMLLLGRFATCPGITDELAYMYLATRCEPHPDRPAHDADERIELVRLTFEQLLGLWPAPEDDYLLDAKTFLLAGLVARTPERLRGAVR